MRRMLAALACLGMSGSYVVRDYSYGEPCEPPPRVERVVYVEPACPPPPCAPVRVYYEPAPCPPPYARAYRRPPPCSRW